MTFEGGFQSQKSLHCGHTRRDDKKCTYCQHISHSFCCHPLSIAHTKAQRLTVNQLTQCARWSSLTEVMLTCTVTGSLQCGRFPSVTVFKSCVHACVTVSNMCVGMGAYGPACLIMHFCIHVFCVFRTCRCEGCVAANCLILLSSSLCLL